MSLVIGNLFDYFVRFTATTQLKTLDRSFLQILSQSGHLRRNYCAATILLAIVLTPQLFLSGCAASI